MSLAYFCLASLAVLPASAVVSPAEPDQSALEVMLKPSQRAGFCDWVYRQQAPSGGFRGSDSVTVPLSPGGSTADDPANIIQTYTALLVLGLFDDDFTRLDRAGLKRFLRACQNADGSFAQFPGCLEAGDPRSSYSAFALCSMLDDWSCIDVEQGLAFLECCRSHEGAYAQRPGLEANAGPTYCVVASYSLAARLHTIPHPDRLLRWLVGRQVRPPPPAPDADSDSDPEESDARDSLIPNRGDTGDAGPLARTPGSEQPTAFHIAGFQGRANKPTDACYSFWNTAALSILVPSVSPRLALTDLVDPSLDRAWLLSCQHPVFGGIAREPDATPDVYHTYLSLAALALGDTTNGSEKSSRLGLATLDAAWNVPIRVAARMRDRLWNDT
ncbi:geranylgeranyl transferase type-1 subunit beta [Rhodotorula sphaerocarpa]